MASLEDVIAALARSVVYHGATQPEDAKTIGDWLEEKKEADADDAKPFKPSTGKK